MLAGPRLLSCQVPGPVSVLSVSPTASRCGRSSESCNLETYSVDMENLQSFLWGDRFGVADPRASMSSVSRCRVTAPAQAFPSRGPCWDRAGCESEQENRYSGVRFSA